MNQKYHHYHSVKRLTIFIFLTMILSGLITLLITLTLIYVLKVELKFLRNPLYLLGMSLLASSLLATIITTLSSKSQMKELNDFLNAINQVSKGDFSIRLGVPKSPQMEVIYQNFNDMVSELSSIETLRNDFVSNFSHEFKTPIVSIKGFAKILLNGDLTKEEQTEYLDIIYQESTRLVMLSENTLNLTKLETQNIVFEKFNYPIDEQVRQCVLILQNEWEEKSLNLNLDLDDLTYLGSPELMQQLFINLISNSIKFSKQNGDIAISLKKVADGYLFIITDNGIGMDEQTSKRIFDKFYQGDLSHVTQGNGLGLSIVKRIVNLINGEITVKSVLNEGTTFLIKF